MTSDARNVNPYQPPSDLSAQLDPNAPTDVSFHLTRGLDRHAEAQFLLHWHPQRLLYGSLAMIAVSLAVLILAARMVGTFINVTASFFVVMVLVLVVTGAIYTAMVHHTKRKLRGRQSEHGLTPDAMITVHSEPDQVTVVTPHRTHTWPNDQLKVYRAPRGLLICPEPLLYIFIPKQSSFQLDSYKQFVGLIESRTQRPVRE